MHLPCFIFPISGIRRYSFLHSPISHFETVASTEWYIAGYRFTLTVKKNWKRNLALNSIHRTFFILLFPSKSHSQFNSSIASLYFLRYQRVNYVYEIVRFSGTWICCPRTEFNFKITRIQSKKKILQSTYINLFYRARTNKC